MFKKKITNEYFFAVLTSCESRILKLGTPLRCRVVKSSIKGEKDVFHVGAEGSDRFVIVKEPVFGKIIGVGADEVLGTDWRDLLHKAMIASKLKFTKQ